MSKHAISTFLIGCAVVAVLTPWAQSARTAEIKDVKVEPDAQLIKEIQIERRTQVDKRALIEPRRIEEQRIQPTQELERDARRRVDPGILQVPKTARIPSRQDAAAATKFTKEFSTLLDKSDWVRADAAYRTEVAKTSDESERATIDLAYANSLARVAKRENDPALLSRANEHFVYAIEKGSQRERVAAINNYATSALGLGDGVKAVQLFEQGIVQANSLPDPAARARYLYNYGNALVQQDRAAEAVGAYLDAYRTNPRELRAAEAAVDAAIASRDVAAAAELLTAQLEHGHIDTAESTVRKLLEEQTMRTQDGFVAVVEGLYAYLLAARVNSDVFEKQWRADIPSSSAPMDQAARNYLSFVPLAYDANMETMLRPDRARYTTAPWIRDPRDSRHASEMLSAPSRFLTGVGELYAEQGLHEEALARYVLAWGLDNSNLEAGQYAANLLIEYREALDPDKGRLDEFVFHVFDRKAQAYLGEDWPAIFRFHSVLAGIFVRDEEWGDSRNARSAIFQLEYALSARERIDDEEARGVAVPGLYSMLATAYEGVGNSKDAFDNYVRAAREALRLSDQMQARRNLDAATNLSYAPSPAQRSTFRSVERRLG